MTAVTHPRVRVENEIKQFSYYGKKLQHRMIDDTNALYFACWQPQKETYTKIVVPEDFEAYDFETDPDEISARTYTAKKGSLNLPKSSAFSAMMRAEMTSVATQGPRKLKKDDYKEYMVETIEEKKALAAKPVFKPKASVKNSWRSNGGFKIPTKEEQQVELQQLEEENKLIPAPMEYRMPAPKPQANQQNKGGEPQQKNVINFQIHFFPLQ
jgi:uncharacterized protein with WD repeat